MIFYFKYKALKKKLDEIIENGLEDTLIKEMIYKNGELSATFEDKTFTRILALWAKESLEQYEAPNFLTLTFGDGKEMFELTVRRNMSGTITPAEKLAMMQKQIDSMRNCYNCNNWIDCMQKNPILTQSCTQDDYNRWELKEIP